MKKFVFCIPIQLLLFLVSCTNTIGSSFNTAGDDKYMLLSLLDYKAPSVVSVYPPDNSTDVIASTDIRATFTEAIKANQNRFIITDDGGNRISGKILYDGATVFFIPGNNLSPGIYTATLTAHITDRIGNKLKKEYEWNFTVSSAPPTHTLNYTLSTISGSDPYLWWSHTLVPGDFNGDGKTDLILRTSESIDGLPSFMLIANESEGFNSTDISNLYGTDTEPTLWGHRALITGDYDGDGKTDIIMKSPVYNDDSYMLIANDNPSGGFYNIEDITTLCDVTRDYWGTRTLITADFNGDGNTDVIMQSTSNSGASYMLIADGLGGFKPTIDVSDLYSGMDLWASRELITGDYNGDGRTDIIMRSKRYYWPSYMLIANENPAGEFNDKIDIYKLYDTSMELWGNRTLITGDYNGDGRTDIIMKSTSTSGATYMLIANNNPSGGFDNKKDISKLYGTKMDWWAIRELITGDFNGDGWTDILMRSIAGDKPTYILQADASDGFILKNVTEQWGMSQGNWGSVKIYTGDFNGDGKTDILLQASGSTSSSKPTRLLLSQP